MHVCCGGCALGWSSSSRILEVQGPLPRFHTATSLQLQKNDALVIDFIIILFIHPLHLGGGEDNIGA